jgi:hypothetical protein
MPLQGVAEQVTEQAHVFAKRFVRVDCHWRDDISNIPARAAR